MKEFAEKFYLKEIALIVFVSLLMFLLYYGKTESFLVDVGREAYVPLRVLEGKLLYKDIFNVYGPLSYQINAAAYGLFGTNLNTLYWMGFVNSLVILISIFFITKNFLSKKLSLCVSFLVMVSCVYIKTFFNFIFPYSYAAVYSLSGILLSILGVMLYIKKKSPLYLILSFFFAGFAFANKIEYLPYFLFLFLGLWFLKPKLKTALLSTAAFFVVPVFSFGILAIQGVSFHDFFIAFDYIQGLVKTPAVEYFYSNYGLYYNETFAKFSLNYFTKLSAFLIPFSLVLYGLNYLATRYLKTGFLKKVLNGGIFIVLLFTIAKTFHTFAKMDMRFFSWIGLFTLAIFFGICILYAFKAFKEKAIILKIKKKEKMFLFLICAAILVSIKGISAVGTECYGTFSLAVLLIVFTIFCARYLPQFIKLIDYKVWNKVILNLFFVTILLVFGGVFRLAWNYPLYKVQTERGTIFVKRSTKDFGALIEFIQKNTEKDAVIVSAPEGAMINFLANRKSHDKYYYLIPVNTQLFGVDKIVSDFEKNPPDYFLLNSLPYYCFNTGNICTYANAFCKFIHENYKIKIKMHGTPEFHLYERSSN